MKKQPVTTPFQDGAYLLIVCEVCKGEGRLQAAKWVQWWSKHKTDWRENQDTAPSEEEFQDCETCVGTGLTPMSHAKPIIELLNWYWGIRERGKSKDVDMIFANIEAHHKRFKYVRADENL